ncbi:MAG: class I SAM-dependent methyltransferase [Crocinitomicaceae bacterium]|nr:class I SAM-dependent methyltransferase [Crocinitomicaceae bacterium]
MPNNLSQNEIKDIIQWDIRNWKNALFFWEAHFDFKPGQKVLVLGDRNGGLSLFFAKKGMNVVCSDFDLQIETAKKLHQLHQIEHLIEYAKVDMRTIPFSDSEFDVVAFKSVLGALNIFEEQNQTMNEIYRVLKKDGALVFAENTKASRFHRWMRSKFAKWQSPWRYSDDSEFVNWSGLYSKSFLSKRGFSALFGRSEGQRNFLGIVDSGFGFIIPKKWKYILMGVFIK